MADLDQNNLSTGQLNSGSGSAQPRLYVSPDRPSDTIPQAQQQLTSTNILQYPVDLPKYHMGFEINKYHRESLMAIGQTQLLSSVFLPFPDQMIDANQVAYDQVRFGATLGTIADIAFKNVQQVGAAAQGGLNSDTAGKVLGATKDAVTGNKDQIIGSVGADVVGGLTGDFGKGVMGAAGYSPNYFLTVILDGPRYKQHTFTWTMAPRNAKEAADLSQIIKTFKDASAAGLSAGGALFTFPRVFKNFYNPNRGHLYQFKPSVLINFTVNYSAGGMPSMKQAQAGTNGWNAPTALRISATFLELEFWLRGDYGSESLQNSNAKYPIPGNRNAP